MINSHLLHQQLGGGEELISFTQTEMCINSHVKLKLKLLLKLGRDSVRSVSSLSEVNGEHAVHRVQKC